jgi:hypothetical protein
MINLIQKEDWIKFLIDLQIIYIYKLYILWKIQNILCSFYIVQDILFSFPAQSPRKDKKEPLCPNMEMVSKVKSYSRSPDSTANRFNPA